MSTKRLKVLISVLACILIFMLGFNAWHGEDIVTELQVQPVVETGATTSWAVNSWNVILTEEIYTWEDVEKEMAEKLNSLIGDYSISYTIVHECSVQTEDYKLCIKNVLWVANAESSMFKKWMYPSNNGFGWMYKGKKRKFSSVEESIKQWVSMYVRNGWAKRTTWASWLKGSSAYCQSACTNWAKAYNAAARKIEKLGLW